MLDFNDTDLAETIRDVIFPLNSDCDFVQQSENLTQFVSLMVLLLQSGSVLAS